MGLWLTLVALTLAPRLVWDPEMGNLVRRGGPEVTGPSAPGPGGKDGPPAPLPPGLDGGPLVAGFVTLLKQLHPAVLDDLFAHLGQYLRSVLHATVASAVTAAATDGPKSTAATEIARAPPALPPDVYALLLLLRLVAQVARVPDRDLHVCVPAYLLHTLLPTGARAD